MTETLRWALRLALVVPLVAAGLAACEGCRSTPSGARAPSSGDDGARPTVRLYFVSDLAGALEPCGCTRDQLGGLDHFGAWVRGTRETTSVALVAAAGPLFFMDEKLDPQKGDQDRIKAQTMARVLHGLGLAAFAPGVNDWAAGPEALAKLAEDAGAVALVPGVAVVRDAGGIRIGFVGYGQDAAGSPDAGASRPPAPEDAVRGAANDARAKGANVLIALVAVGRGEAKRIADAVPDLTAVVVGSARASGDANTTAPPVERVGDVLIVQAANHLQSAAVLDLFVRDAASPGTALKFADGTGLELARRREDLAGRIDDLHVRIAAWERDKDVPAADLEARKRDLARLEAERDSLDRRPAPARGSFFRYTVQEIRESLGKDPAIESDLASYYKAVDDHNRVEFADRAPAPAPPGQAGYVGIEKCSTCHAGPRRVFDGTAHAHAYATLTSQFKAHNLDCVSCHVTGYERPGGSTVTHVDGLTDVQCEVCHGPGSRHAQNPGDPASIVARPDPSTCLSCHHSPHVEGFDPSLKMRAILGPGHGMPAR